MEVRGDAHAEGAAALAPARVGIDPVALEELGGHVAHAPGSDAERLQHQLPTFRVGNLGHVAAERGVLVVDHQRLDAEQFALEGEVFVGDRVVFGGHAHHLLDRLRVHLVAEVTDGHRVGVVAQAVHGELVLDQRLVNEGENRPLGLQTAVEHVVRLPAQLAVGLGSRGPGAPTASTPAAHRRAR